LNRQISQLFGLAVILFTLLIVFTSRWTVFEAQSLEDETANRRPLIEEQQVPRGLIYARDGQTLLARNRAIGRGQNRIFSRVYPTGALFGHPVGYSFLRNGRRGLEQSYNDDLAGQEDEFESILSDLENRTREGFDVVTNLDAEAQRTAYQALGSQRGAVVAIEPQTGKVRVMASNPPFDPNRVPSDFSRLNRDPGKPMLNRSTQEQYPPGSTFKVVTAAAGIDTGKVTPETVIDGSSPRTVSGTPLSNFGGEDFGPITLTDALTHSVNTVFAQVGEKVGRETMVDYMRRFGFYEDPKLDFPDDQMIASGVRNANGDLVGANSGFDVGRVAIGQGGAEGQILSTPLQMAEVAAAIANDGKLMKPRLVDRVLRKDGRVRERVEPDLQNEVIKPSTAKELAEMMSRVVEEGTGTAAALEGVNVAGKTGTAEVGANAELTQPWFIAFAPVEDPRVAIAVTVERSTGEGGTVAAPIAKQVLEVLLRNG
jgi:peptidoglycan glycosyltransferase